MIISPHPDRLSASGARRLPLSACVFRLLIGCLALHALPLAAASPDDDFAAANALFQNGDFQKAADAYRELVDSGFGSPDVLYNLGDALYRSDRRGEAALEWRRALTIDPQHAEARQNLGFLGRKTGFVDYSDDQSTFGDFFPANTWLIVLTTAAWTAVLGIAVLAFFRLRGAAFALPVVLVTLSLSAIGIAAVAIYQAEQRKPAENLAIVTSEATKAYTEPSTSADSVISLPPGSEVKILLSRESWTYVDIPGTLRGWVESKAVAPLQS